MMVHWQDKKFHVHFHVIPRTDINRSNPMWRATSPQSEPDFEALAALSQSYNYIERWRNNAIPFRSRC